MRIALIILIAVFFGSYTLGVLLNKNEPLNNVICNSACNLLHGECYVNDSDVEYKIMFDDAPSSLIPFNVQLIPIGSQPVDVFIEFEMEGMDMGQNFHSLNNHGKFWSAKVILPVCSLGRNDWKMRVKFITDKKTHLTEFGFVQSAN